MFQPHIEPEDEEDSGREGEAEVERMEEDKTERGHRELTKIKKEWGKQKQVKIKWRRRKR